MTDDKTGPYLCETLEDVRRALAKFAPANRESAIAQLLAEDIIDELDAEFLRGKFEDN